MSDPAAKSNEPMRFETVEAFFDWAMAQPGRYELVNGEAVAMSPERIEHAATKFEAAIALRNAVRKAGLPCTVLPDGATVRASDDIVYEPDVTVQCAPLDMKGIVADAPVIVVEVISPSTRNLDTYRKLAGYFEIPSLIHYLILDIDRRALIHHERGEDAIRTRILSEGTVRLDPPGIEVAVADFFLDPA